MPFLLTIIGFVLSWLWKDFATSKILLINLDKNLAVGMKEIEILVHDNKIIWQRIDDMRERLVVVHANKKR